jgi:predicted PurR-regulated permease PerM
MNPGHKQLIQIALVALLLIGCIAVLLPFTGTLLFAIVICVTTLPIRNRLLRLCRGRSNLAALLVSILLLLLLVAPWPCSRARLPTASRSPFATSSP